MTPKLIFNILILFKYKDGGGILTWFYVVVCFVFMTEMENQTTTMTTIVATYEVCSTFFLPTWMKREDIEEYFIKYDRLHITLKNGKEYTIDPRWSATESDLKRPDEVEEETEELYDEEEVEEINDLCNEVEE